MTDLYLSLGSNQGNRKELLRKAVQELETQIGRVCALSEFYETAPWGFTSENLFLNTAIHLKTLKTPAEILAITQNIEKQLGRKVKSNGISYQDRPIDIDLLFLGNCCMDKQIQLPDGRLQQLTLPHKLLHERDFVLKPLVEIAPDLMHPLLNCSVRELWQRLYTSSNKDCKEL